MNRELVQEWAAHWPATGDLNRWATHVDAVVDLFSDRGSIPRASIKRQRARHSAGSLPFELSASSHQPSARTSADSRDLRRSFMPGDAASAAVADTRSSD